MLSVVGVDTAVTSASSGGTATVNEFTERVLLAFPEESVTVIVQSEYVPSSRDVKVMLLLPEETDEVVLLQLPPYVIVPASSEENV